MTWIKLDEAPTGYQICPHHQTHERASHVYLIGMVEHPLFVKIGTAMRPDWRVGELQCGNPFTLKLLCASRVCCQTHGRQLERSLHQRFRPFSYGGGEWFHLGDDGNLHDVIEAISTLKGNA